MSETLINQNQIASEEWVKPSDWVDIRSGALPNSIYFLVGHSADFTKYPEFSFTATISNSGTYDVFVDGVKQATTSSGSDTLFNWQTLNLASGFDVTYPEALKTHIVRVTPTADTDTINAIKLVANSSVNQGLLWAHFAITNEINIAFLLGNNYSGITYRCSLIEAVTSTDNLLKISYHGIIGAFVMANNLKTVPTIDVQSMNSEFSFSFANCTNLQKIKIINAKNTAPCYNLFMNCSSLNELDITPYLRNAYADVFYNLNNLKKLPALKLSTISNTNFVNLYKLQDSFLDFSNQQKTPGWEIRGSAGHIQNIVGIVVNPSMEATGNWNFSYNKMNRQALVNLFNSMPYNVGYEKVGTPTITDGTMSNITANNYARINYIPDLSKPFELGLAFTINEKITYSGGEGPFLFDTRSGSPSTGLAIYMPDMDRLSWLLGNGGGSNWVSSRDLIGMSFQLNTKYYFKLIFDGQSYTPYISTNKTDWTPGAVITNSETASGLIRPAFGKNLSWGKPFTQGDIHLSDCYLNIDNIPWFKGTAQATRTLDIRGCTGTSDLTQDDKNIVLNKGWALTVA
jgi:hypothetical protein